MYMLVYTVNCLQGFEVIKPFILGPTYGSTGKRLSQTKLGKDSFNPQVLRLGGVSAFKRTSFPARKPAFGWFPRHKVKCFTIAPDSGFRGLEYLWLPSATALKNTYPQSEAHTHI